MTEREREFGLTDFIELLRRRKGVIIGSAIILAIFFTLIALASYPAYESKGSFMFTTQSGSVSMLSVFFTMSGGSTQIFSEIEILRSRSIAEAVIDDCDLKIKIEDFTHGGQISRAFKFVVSDRLRRGLRSLRIDEADFSDSSIDKPFFVIFTDNSGNYRVTGQSGELGTGTLGEPFKSDAISFTVTSMKGPAGTRFKLTPQTDFIALRKFQETLRVAPLGSATRTSLIQVSYRSSDPTLASDVVNSVIREYNKRDREWKSSQSEMQTEEIEERLNQAKEWLEQAEADLEAYKNLYGVISLPDEARLAVGELAQREAMKIDIDLRLNLTNQIYSSLASSLENDTFAVPPSLTADQVIQQLAGEHARLMMELENLLLDYTESHPTVIAKREAIRVVRRNILEALQATIDSLNDQKSQLNRVISGMTDDLYRIPGVERELIDLTRRRDMSDEAFRLLTRRLSEAELVKASIKLGNRIIDYAAPSARPVAPSIKRNLAFGFGLGLILGVFMGFLMEAFEMRIRRRDDLEAVCGMVPVIEVSGDERSISRAVGLIALASMHSENKIVSIVYPGPETGNYRNIIASTAYELANSLSPLILVDCTADTIHAGFFDTELSPGLSEIASGGSFEPSNISGGKIKIVPPGAEPSGAHSANPNVREWVVNLASDSGLTVLNLPNINAEIALRGWSAVTASTVLVVMRHRDSRNAVIRTIESLNEDNVRIHGAILLDE